MKGPRGRAGRNALPGASPGNLSSKFGTAPRGTLARTPSTPRGVIAFRPGEPPLRQIETLPRPHTWPGAPRWHPSPATVLASPTPPGRHPIRFRTCWPGQRRPDVGGAPRTEPLTTLGAARAALRQAPLAPRRELQRSTIKTPRCASSSASGSAAGLCTSSGSSRRGCFASDFLRWASSRRRICSMMNGGNIGRLFLGFTVPHRDYPS